jgi:hypothetical protein
MLALPAAFEGELAAASSQNPFIPSALIPNYMTLACREGALNNQSTEEGALHACATTHEKQLPAQYTYAPAN